MASTPWKAVRPPNQEWAIDNLYWVTINELDAGFGTPIDQMVETRTTWTEAVVP